MMSKLTLAAVAVLAVTSGADARLQRILRPSMLPVAPAQLPAEAAAAATLAPGIVLPTVPTTVAEDVAEQEVPAAAETHLFMAAAVPQGAKSAQPAQLGAADSWVLYKQCGQSWSGETLGTATGTTICDAGCAMSSVAMIYKTKGADVNPGTLNSWLRDHGGYAGGDELVWSAPDALGHAKMENYYRGSGSMSQTAMQDAIKAGKGIVVNVRNGGHWVLVTGHIDGSTYAVNDPGFAVDSYVYGDMSNYVVYASA